MRHGGPRLWWYDRREPPGKQVCSAFRGGYGPIQRSSLRPARSEPLPAAASSPPGCILSERRSAASPRTTPLVHEGRWHRGRVE
eukprot:2933427-Prymnesium_polylepis.2